MNGYKVQEFNTIECLAKEVIKSLEKNLYFAALSTALIIPDLCGQIEFPNEVDSKGKRMIGTQYIKWFDTWISQYEEQDDCCPNITGRIVYKLRCSFFHSGESDILKHSKINDLTEFILALEPYNEANLYVDYSSYGINSKGEEESILVENIHNVCNKISWCALKFVEKFNTDEDKLPKFTAIVNEKWGND